MSYGVSDKDSKWKEKSSRGRKSMHVPTILAKIRIITHIFSFVILAVSNCFKATLLCTGLLLPGVKRILVLTTLNFLDTCTRWSIFEGI